MNRQELIDDLLNILAIILGIGLISMIGRSAVRSADEYIDRYEKDTISIIDDRTRDTLKI
jgi:hypothetical protein